MTDRHHPRLCVLVIYPGYECPSSCTEVRQSIVILLFTVGLARKPCPHGRVCQGPSGGMFGASMNNISFSFPTKSLLQSFFMNSRSTMLKADENKGKPMFPTNFPDMPTIAFNFTGTQPKNLTPKRGTRLSWLAYNSSVQLILQGTSILGTESHPIHLHGFNFYVVGQGSGNYNNKKDPALFNLVDPQERNTINVPMGDGWLCDFGRTTQVREQCNTMNVFENAHITQPKLCTFS